MTKVSKEHFPTNANALEDADLSMTLALRSTAKARTGTTARYGCHTLYVNLDSCVSSNAKYQSIATNDAPTEALTPSAHCGCSVIRCSRVLITATAAKMPAYTIHKSRLTRKAHSRADHSILKTYRSTSKTLCSNHSVFMNHVTAAADRKSLPSRNGVRSLYWGAMAMVAYMMRNHIETSGAK